MMNVLSGATFFCKITHAPNIFMIRVIGTHQVGLFLFLVSIQTQVLIWDTLGLSYFLVEVINMKLQKKGMFYCITFLHFLKSDQGVHMNSKRIKVIPEWPTPPSVRKIWGFHDLTNFYKKVCPIFFYTCSTTHCVGEEPCSFMGRCPGNGFSDLTLLQHTKHH